MKVQYRVFRSNFQSWDDLFNAAAAFATELGSARLIGISHSCQSTDGVVTVWYWEE